MTYDEKKAWLGRYRGAQQKEQQLTARMPKPAKRHSIPRSPSALFPAVPGMANPLPAPWNAKKSWSAASLHSTILRFRSTERS